MVKISAELVARQLTPLPLPYPPEFVLPPGPDAAVAPVAGVRPTSVRYFTLNLRLQQIHEISGLERPFDPLPSAAPPASAAAAASPSALRAAGKSMTDAKRQNADATAATAAVSAAAAAAGAGAAAERFVVALNLSVNRLTAIGAHLSSVACARLAGSLQVLDVSRNMITAIEHVSALKALRVLNVSNNHLTSVEGLDGVGSTLTALDVSMNRITALGDGLARCTALHTLLCYGNELTGALSGLGGCANLRVLHAQRNRLTDATHVGACTRLEHLNLADNQLTDLDALQNSLVLCPGLTALTLAGNPLCADAASSGAAANALAAGVSGSAASSVSALLMGDTLDASLAALMGGGLSGGGGSGSGSGSGDGSAASVYRMRLMENAALRVLDGVPIKAFLRAKWNEFAQHKEVDAIISGVQSEYVARIRLEEERKQQLVAALREHERRAEDTFADYRKAMERELEAVLTYLRAVRDRTEAVPAWARTPQGIAEWSAALRRLEAERTAAHDRLRSERHAQAFTDAQALSFGDKLYQIALHKPDVWRAMKARELALSRDEEARDLRERRRDTRDARDRDAKHHPTAGAAAAAAAASDAAGAAKGGGYLSTAALAAAAIPLPRHDNASAVRSAVGHAHVLHRLTASADAAGGTATGAAAAVASSPLARNGTSFGAPLQLQPQSQAAPALQRPVSYAAAVGATSPNGSKSKSKF